MKGVKLISGFLVLMALSWFGMLFIKANDGQVSISLGLYSTQPMPLGFIILSSAFAGMVFSGILSIYEMVGLYVQNRILRKKLDEQTKHSTHKNSLSHDHASIQPTLHDVEVDR